MKNNYGLPRDELEKIFERDKVCVYCHKAMLEHGVHTRRGDWYTIEHFNILPPWNNPATVAICCWSCNSSRGNKLLSDWFSTEYCLTKNINKNTVAKPVKKFIKTETKI